jgi:hypothetical protein
MNILCIWGRLLNAFGGIVPFSIFFWTENTLKEELFQIEMGITPLKLLKLKLSQLNLDKNPKDDGIVPDRVLPSRARPERLERFPKLGGISPDNLFWLKARFSIT